MDLLEVCLLIWGARLEINLVRLELVLVGAVDDDEGLACNLLLMKISNEVLEYLSFLEAGVSMRCLAYGNSSGRGGMVYLLSLDSRWKITLRSDFGMM